MAKLVSKTYGEALYGIASEEGKTGLFLEEIREIREVLAANPDFGKLMRHPRISKEEKEAVMETVFKGRVSEELTGFLILLLQKERYRELEHILRYFEDRVKAEEGVGVAYVVTATELTEEKRRQVERRLLETTAFREMEVHFSVDASLIGGMVIRIGDRVADSSIRTKLENLTKQLYRLQLQS